MTDHSTCRPVLIDGMARQGVDVTVSTAPPLVANAYNLVTSGAFVCPHGERFYMEPTGEQIAQWGDTHRQEVARLRLDHLLDKLAATLPRQEQP